MISTQLQKRTLQKGDAKSAKLACYLGSMKASYEPHVYWGREDHPRGVEAQMLGFLF